jgi:hypothetical protein
MYILAKNLFIFCSCLQSLSETQFKNNVLVYLVEEISRKPIVQHGYC